MDGRIDLGEGIAVAVLGYTPPSFNAVGFTGNRWKVTSTVKALKADLGPALMVAGLPRHLAFVRADARLTFADRRRRDPENYRVLLSKALGDVLAPHTGRGWLPDDTADYFKFGDVDLRVVRGVKLTEIVLRYRRATGA